MKGIIFGPPGAGKGTQGKYISDLLAIPVISTGQIIRDAVADSGPATKELQDIISKGGFSARPHNNRYSY